MSDSKLRSELIRTAATSTPAVKKAILSILKPKTAAPARTAAPSPAVKKVGKAIEKALDLLAKINDAVKADSVLREDEQLNEWTKSLVQTIDMVGDHFQETYEGEDDDD